MARIQVKNKRKVIISLFCVVMAFLIVFIGLPKVTKRESAVTQVVKVRDIVEANTEITDEMLEVVKVGKFGLPTDVITKKEDIIGKFAVNDIIPSDLLVPQKFMEMAEKENAYLYELDDGRVAVSVTVPNLASVLSGKLEKGDIVQVYVYKKNESVNSYGEPVAAKDEIVEFKELQYVEVVGVTNNKTEDVDKVADKIEESEENTTTNQNIIPSTVVFRCYKEQAKKLVEAENLGKIHIVFIGRGEEVKENFLAKQREILGIKDPVVTSEAPVEAPTKKEPSVDVGTVEQSTVESVNTTIPPANPPSSYSEEEDEPASSGGLELTFEGE